MSKKRTSAESNNDEQTNEGSESLFRKEDNAKRAKLDLLSHTTLQDLPIEMLECILVKVVVMEVKGMKMAKSVWKEKADLVISRLTTVCSHWSSILTTNFFRNELHGALDGTAQQTIRLEILHQSPIQSPVYAMTTLKDEIFMLCRSRDQDSVINVYNRNNTEEVKAVIPLPGTYPVFMAACNVSNCVYLGLMNNLSLSVSRITKDEEHKFSISPWINNDRFPLVPIYVSANGSLIISEKEVNNSDIVLSIYNANGSLQHEIVLSPDPGCRSSTVDECIHHVIDVFLKANGNLVLVSSDDEEFNIKLLEVDTSGNVVRQYLSSLTRLSNVYFTSIYDRILIATQYGEGIELLDSEFNLLDFFLPQQSEEQFHFLDHLHCNSERNELMCILSDDSERDLLTIFRFTDE